MKIIVVIIGVLFLTSCQQEEIQPNPTPVSTSDYVSFNVNGNSYLLEYIASANLLANSMSFLAVDDNGTPSISNDDIGFNANIPSPSVGSFQIGNMVNSTNVIIQGIGYIPLSDSVGVFTIVELNTITKRVRGTFEMETNNGYVSNGLFDIGYTE